MKINVGSVLCPGLFHRDHYLILTGTCESIYSKFKYRLVCFDKVQHAKKGSIMLKALKIHSLMFFP